LRAADEDVSATREQGLFWPDMNTAEYPACVALAVLSNGDCLAISENGDGVVGTVVGPI
jgi:hypothetical protein